MTAPDISTTISTTQSDLWAAIDVGTNSTLLLIARLSMTDSIEDVPLLEPLFEQTATTRLGRNLDHTGKLDELSIRETVLAIEKYYHFCLKQGVPRSQIRVVGTHALRCAENSESLIKILFETFRLSLQVLSPNQEAKAAWLGTRAGLPHLELPLLVFDIGGGSTELIYQEDRRSKPFFSSLPLGCVRLAEEFSLKEVAFQKHHVKVNNRVKEILAQNDLNPSRKLFNVVGIGGTMTTLGSIHLSIPGYDANKIHGLLITKTRLEEIAQELYQLTPEQRRSVTGLEHDRADIIGPGLIICRQILRKFAIPSLTINTWGIRHGILLSHEWSDIY